MTREKFLLFSIFVIILGIVFSILSIIGRFNRTKIISKITEMSPMQKERIESVEISIHSRSFIKLVFTSFVIRYCDFFSTYSYISYLIGSIIQVIFADSLLKRISFTCHMIFIIILFFINIKIDKKCKNIF